MDRFFGVFFEKEQKEDLQMIKWMYYPKNKRIDEDSLHIVEVFQEFSEEVDSETHEVQESNRVLAVVRPGLEAFGFVVETGKKKGDLISVPVLFGENGRVEKSFFVDAYNENAKYVIEVEAGRAVTNYQFLKDFFEACIMYDVDTLCIAVRNTYKSSKDFLKVCAFFDSLYASGKFQIPLKGLLILGY